MCERFSGRGDHIWAAPKRSMRNRANATTTWQSLIYSQLLIFVCYAENPDRIPLIKSSNPLERTIFKAEKSRNSCLVWKIFSINPCAISHKKSFFFLSFLAISMTSHQSITIQCNTYELSSLASNTNFSFST